MPETSPTAATAVRVRNDGDTDYTDGYNGNTYTIPAGGDAFVPFDAACLWLGDPRLQNLGPRDKHRANEYTRIATRMGAAEADRESFNEVRPALAVFNANTGIQMKMVADDPDGPGEDVFGSGEAPEDVQGRIHRLETALAKIASEGSEGGMASVLADLGIGDVNAPKPDPVKAKATGGAEPPVDSPKRPRVSAGR